MKMHSDEQWRVVKRALWITDVFPIVGLVWPQLVLKMNVIQTQVLYRLQLWSRYIVTVEVQMQNNNARPLMHPQLCSRTYEVQRTMEVGVVVLDSGAERFRFLQSIWGDSACNAISRSASLPRKVCAIYFRSSESRMRRWPSTRLHDM